MYLIFQTEVPKYLILFSPFGKHIQQWVTIGEGKHKRDCSCFLRMYVTSNIGIVSWYILHAQYFNFTGFIHRCQIF